MAAQTLVPLADHEHGTIYLQDGNPAARATARVFTRRKGELVELPVWADPEKTRRLAQPLTAGRDGRLPGLVHRRPLEVEATWRGRTITTADIKAAAVTAQQARDAEREAHAQREAGRTEKLAEKRRRDAHAARTAPEKAARLDANHARRLAEREARAQEAEQAASAKKAHEDSERARRLRDRGQRDRRAALAADEKARVRETEQAARIRERERADTQAAQAAQDETAAHARAQARLAAVRDAINTRAATILRRRRLLTRDVPAPRGTALTIEIDAASLDVTIVTPDYEPVFDPDRSADTLNLAPGFGIDSGGLPYYDTTGPAAGEEAVLGVSQNLELVLVSA